MEDSGSIHHHYYPAGLIPITAQSRALGFPTEVFISPTLWGEVCAWEGKSRQTNTNKRIIEMCQAFLGKLDKKIAAEKDFGDLSFKFKHFYWERYRPKAKKKARIIIGARLLLNPDDNLPWMLLYDPDYDYINILTAGTEPSVDSELHVEQPEGPDKLHDIPIVGTAD